MRVSGGLGRARRLVVVLAAAVLPLGAAGLALAGAGPAAASPATHHQFVKTKGQWQAAISKVAEPGTGCYHASYPAVRWHAAKCVVAPKVPLAPSLTSRGAPRSPATVGNALDYSAQTSGLITRAVGTFQDVSSGITEKGQFDGTGPKIANAFSLQLNTQFFTGSPACAGSSDPSGCLGWQQFVYAYESHTGFIFMQYWLIDYDAACPGGWFTYSIPPSTTDCYTNSNSATTSSPLTAKELSRVKLVASANSGGNDELSLSVGSGTATLVTGPDSMVDLAAFWDTTEWDVFGDAGGGEAFFGSGTTIEPTTALTTGNSSAPSCIEDGFTAETNNLNLASTPKLVGQPSPTLASRQTNRSGGAASCATAGTGDTSATSLKLSASRVTFGHEKTEHLTVHVTSSHSGAVTGKATITARPAKGKSVKVCVITVKNGAGSCRLSNKALKSGTWKLTAAYGGAPGIRISGSPAKTLKVRK